MILQTACPKFLDLLAEFYRGLAEPPPLDAALIDAETMPQPYRRLLVHQSDMTSTLKAFLGEEVALRVLERRMTDEVLARHIVLEGAESNRPIEYGAIRIQLGPLHERARREVVECRQPLGAILAHHGMLYRSCPGGFFKVHSNSLMRRVLRLDGRPWLYGRCNCLKDASARLIAEVVEILPVLNAERT